MFLIEGVYFLVIFFFIILGLVIGGNFRLYLVFVFEGCIFIINF